MKEILAPTLWRTCRTLASRQRLSLLRCVFRHSSVSVSEAARACDLTVDKASLMLRQMQARGLISVRQSGRSVFYRAAADARVCGAQAILDAVRHSMETGGELDKMISIFTAYTHPRRIRLVQALQRRAAGGHELQESCSMSKQAFHRHIGKLTRRAVVGKYSEGYQLLPPSGALAKTLLRMACNA
jgi:DNA-binding IclR family transcriptional regulator